MKNKLLEVDTSKFETKKQEAEGRWYVKSMAETLKTYLREKGYRLSEDNTEDGYIIHKSLFSIFNLAKFRFLKKQSNDYYIHVVVTKRNFRLVKSLFEDFLFKNRIKVKISIEWSDSNYQNKDEEEKCSVN